MSLGRLLLIAVDDFGRRCWCENGVDRFLQLERLKSTMVLTVFLQLERSKSTPGLGATHAICFFRLFVLKPMDEVVLLDA